MPYYVLSILPRLLREVNIIKPSRMFHTSQHRGNENVTTSQRPIEVDRLPPAPKVPKLGQTEREVREIRIPVPWGHIAGKWWGNPDSQPVLLLHGWQDNAGTFDNLVPLLTVESLFAVDMVGHGLSSHYHLGQCCHYIDALVNLRRVVRHFGWSKLTIIGHSMGSSLGFGYAACYPDGVDKFVSIEGARAVIAAERGEIGQDLRKVIDANHSLEKKLARSPPTYKYDDIIDLYLKGIHYSTDKTAISPILERGLKKFEGGDAFCFARDPRVKVVSWGSFSVNLVLASAAQIACEVLNIRARKGYTVGKRKERVYQQTLDILERTAAAFYHHEVEGTHYVHLNHPEVIAPLVNAFLDKKPSEILIY